MVPILLLARWLRSVARTLKEEQWPRHWTLLSHTGVPQTDPGHISIARSAARLGTTVQIADKLSAHAATIEAGFQTLWGSFPPIDGPCDTAVTRLLDDVLLKNRPV
jgi:hypothetical protein